MKRNRTVVALLSGVLFVSGAKADVPVEDNKVTGEKLTRDSLTSKVEETDKNRFVQNKSVTCSVYRPAKGGDPNAAAQANPEIAGLIKRVAREEGVDETLFMGLVYQESRFNPCARSQVGAIGLSQLMPALPRISALIPTTSKKIFVGERVISVSSSAPTAETSIKRLPPTMRAPAM